MVPRLPGASVNATRGMFLTLGLMAGPLCAAAQHSLVARADMGAVDPQSGYRLAWDGAVGRQFSEHSALFLELGRQNLSEENGGPSSFWETSVGGAWEYALGTPWMMRRQFFLTTRAGWLLRPGPLAGAPYFGAGVGFRYPVADWIRFQARLEEVLDAPRSQTLNECDAFGDCGPLQVGGTIENHLGLFVGVEVVR